ncbi:hypothetical protein [Massilia sp. CF038]|uniref:hypothetical protein n=1 Tax=Massilia sp. CF038 TaxID=1881045 RepID=UPI00090F9753|nr:hypothetical protein [Massilia sp. CF038]SHG48830.1 hypothetical protein SAMN05428948_0694 [Massilia sp. CF038]
MRLFPLCALALLMHVPAYAAPVPMPMQADEYVAPAFSAPAAAALIILLPAQSGGSQYDAANGFVIGQLQAQLVAAGYRVKGLDAANYDLLWQQEAQAAGGLYDPLTGDLRTEAYFRAMSALAQRIAAATGAALVIKPALVLRDARLLGTTAQWDGQRKMPKAKNLFNDTVRYDGITTAISVEFIAMSGEGELAFKTFGGVTLPHRGDMWDGKQEVRDDLFANDKEIAEGVSIALRPLLKK